MEMTPTVSWLNWSPRRADTSATARELENQGLQL